MTGQIGCFHTSSADFLSLLISDHPLCITGPYHLRPIAALPACEEHCCSEPVARPDLQLKAISKLDCKTLDPLLPLLLPLVEGLELVGIGKPSSSELFGETMIYTVYS